MYPELQQRLRALGVAKRVDRPPSRSREPGLAIEELVAGRFYTTSRGRCFVAETYYPPGYRHGQLTLPPHLKLAPALTALAALDHGAADPASSEHLCFLDIETTDLSVGSGTLAFVVGVGFFSPEPEGGFHLHQYVLRDPGDEPAMIERLSEQLAAFRVLVSFNGRAFDVPILDNRFILARIPPPTAELIHLDLLPLARRLWHHGLSSCALSVLERTVLGVLRTQDDVPGSLIPWLYRDYLRTGDARQMRGVLYHNAMDILSMVALTIRLQAILAGSHDEAEMTGAELYGLGRWHEAKGRLAEAEAAYRAALEAPTAKDVELRKRTLHSLALLLKRSGRHEEACTCWEQLAQMEHSGITPCVELAKHFEWRAGDPAQAAEWTRVALARVENWPADSARTEVLARLRHRLARLERKCIGSNSYHTDTSNHLRTVLAIATGAGDEHCACD
ncbi:MAG: ribonuclease H-like domain-containing protein [Anaerolineae bacterium]|nr:ribonuclease H-like domain-containing protein [Anaerolineae bacterium]